MIPSSVYLMEVDIRPDHNEQSMGRSLAGSERMIAGPTALWTANLSVLVPNAAYEEWTGFLDGLRGSEKFFNYFPTGEGQLIPSATPVTWENNSAPVTWISGAQTITWSTRPFVRNDTGIFSETLTIRHPTKANEWKPGVLFSLKGSMYRVAAVDVTNVDVVTLTVTPRLRAEVREGDLIRAGACLMRLRTGDSGRIPKPITTLNAQLELVEHL